MRRGLLAALEAAMRSTPDKFSEGGTICSRTREGFRPMRTRT